MQTMENIQQNIKGLNNYEQWLARKEIQQLPEILWDDECVADIAQGLYDNHNGLLVATNKRLIFISNGLLWGCTVEDFLYTKISSLHYTTGILFGKILITAQGSTAKIEQLYKDACKLFCSHVQELIADSQVQNVKIVGSASIDKIFCTNCGHQLSPTDKFCSFCGHPRN